MAEIGTVIYMSHPQAEIHVKLGLIFRTINDIPKPDLDVAEKTLRFDAATILPKNSDELVDQLIQEINEASGDPKRDFVAESREYRAGYVLYYFVFGGDGESVLSALLKYVNELVVGVDVRGYLYGDDDPWEVFYRLESGSVIGKEYEPVHEERDSDTLPAEYQWWHKGLPIDISEGFINEWKSIDDDEWNESYVTETEEDVSPVRRDMDVLKNSVGTVISGKIYRTPRTESGKIIKDDRNKWPCNKTRMGFKRPFDAIISDMSEVQHGDVVQVTVLEVDESNRLLNSKLLERFPKVEGHIGGELVGRVWSSPRGESGLVIKDPELEWPVNRKPRTATVKLEDGRLGFEEHYTATLEDMGLVKRGDIVRIKVTDIDIENRVLFCSLLKRMPKPS